MPAYRITISDKESVSEAMEHHASLEHAQQSAARTAMAFLSEEGHPNYRHVAECKIPEVGGAEQSHFFVAIELTLVPR